MEEPAAESVVGSGIDTDTKIDTAAPLEVTVRVTFVGQKANQGQLLPLLLPAAACRQAEAPVDPWVHFSVPCGFKSDCSSNPPVCIANGWFAFARTISYHLI
jgi:hypothetical protein